MLGLLVPIEQLPGWFESDVFENVLHDVGQVVVQQRLDQVKLLLDLQLRVDVGQWQAVETIHSEGRLNPHWAPFKNALRVPTWPWPGPFKAWKGQPQTIKQLPSKEVNVYWLLIYLPILLRSWQNLPLQLLVLPQVQCHFDATWPMSKPIFGSLTATGKKHI